MSTARKLFGREPLWDKPLGDLGFVGPTLLSIQFWLTLGAGFLLGAWIF